MSQFRKDPVSGEWVIMAPERSGRPHDFKARQKRKFGALKDCPFEDLKKTGNWPPVLSYEEKGKWRMVVIPNKYPALKHADICPVESVSGPYRMMEGSGYHEILVTRGHRKDFGEISSAEAFQVFKSFAERYRSIDADKCMAYLSIFGNRGPLAGASLEHPHYQLMALPIIPPVVQKSYDGSERYYKKHKRCVHCEMLAFERREGERVIAENEGAIAFAPFVSYGAYEVRIFPKKHIAAFEDSPDGTLQAVSALLQKIIQKMKKKLGDPDYNFYIHTAPLRNQERYGHYHWHIELSPRVSIRAGFEFATGLDVNAVAPEAVARLLK